MPQLRDNSIAYIPHAAWIDWFTRRRAFCSLTDAAATGGIWDRQHRTSQGSGVLTLTCGGATTRAARGCICLG